MARPFRVSVSGLDKLARHPEWLDKGQREFLGKASRRLADAIAEQAPGGKSGRIGRTADARTLSSTKAEITVSHPGAKALETGAYIRPKRAKALRFEVGGQVVFTRRPVRLAPRGYAKKALAGRGRIVRAAYNEAFDRLGEL